MDQTFIGERIYGNNGQKMLNFWLVGNSVQPLPARPNRTAKPPTNATKTCLNRELNKQHSETYEPKQMNVAIVLVKPCTVNSSSPNTRKYFRCAAISCY